MNERITLVYGAGVTGRSACKGLLALNRPVKLYLDPSDKEGRDAERREFQAMGVEVLEGLDAVSWDEVGLIIKSPGIPLDTPFLLAARERGIEAVSDLEFAYRQFGGDRLIAVTGSNGKTTTVSLIAHILNESGRRALAVGNIGVGILDAMLREPEDTLFVCECSSFQLASVSTFAPHLAAILNITPDHISWHGSMEEYARCKANLGAFQSPDDVLVLNPRDPLLKRFASEGRFTGKVEWIDSGSALADALRHDAEAWHLLGEHNVENALFAASLCAHAGLSEKEIAAGLASFRAIAHRMERLGVIDGVEYINDSKATNVDSAVKALSGVKRPVLLIAGGMDKHVPFDELYEAFRPHGKLLILFGETKEMIAEGAEKNGLGDKTIVTDTLRSAFEIAREHAEEGDVVLLSPACASWDMYKNFEERGDEFRALVESLER